MARAHLLLLVAAAACTPTVPYDAGDAVDTASDDGGDDGGDAGGELDGDDEVEHLEGITSDSDALFEDGALPEFYLELGSEDFDHLASDPYEYTEVSMVHEGVTYGPIGLRTKGENSWRPFREKSSLKLDFNRYEGGPDRFMGMKGLTFQAMNEDYSMMHERVAYRMFREAGVPAVRANHALVYVNGELYGLFTMLDSVDDIMMERWYDDGDGPMYEQHDGDVTLDYVQNNTYFQHESGEDDRTALVGLATALSASGAGALEEAGQYLDWEEFWDFWAVSGLVMQFDAYPFRFAGDDCHLYVDPADGRIDYLPHGIDESFYYDDNFETRANGHISARCREVPACRDAWAERVYVNLEIFEAFDLAAYAEQVADEIEPWAQADPHRNYNMDYVRYYQNDMITKLQHRRASVEGFIGPRPE